jgi:tetratricopeptide (TPR) repeat protein
MIEIIEFLSGKVPGGITLYLFLVVVTFLVLYYLYRYSELISKFHFVGWLLGCWILFSVIYIYVWTKYPPPELLKRYSLFISTEKKDDRWLAYFFRDELSYSLRSFHGKSNILYLQHWNYLANSDFTGIDSEELARRLDLNQVLLGKVYSDKNSYSLKLQLLDISRNQVLNEFSTLFSSENPGQILSKVIKWLENIFPVKQNYQFSGIVDKRFYLARDAFFIGNYKDGERLFNELLESHPGNTEMMKWGAFNSIRLAGSQRKLQQNKNPFDNKKMPWEIKLAKARKILKEIIREDVEGETGDYFISNMLGESYLFEENFNDAATFFLNAYVENPFNIITLENISHLHQSRFAEYGFKDIYQIYERIIGICPLYEEVLIKYCKRLLQKGPVHGVPTEQARKLIEDFLSINSNSVTAWILLSEYYRSILQVDNAIQSLNKAKALQPDNSIVLYNLGVNYFLDKKLEDAELFFLKAVEVDDYLDAYLYLGAIYMERGHYKKALEKFRHRVANKTGDDDKYAFEAMKGIRECLKKLNMETPVGSN